MKLEFLSPLGGLLILGVAVPLAAILFIERRSQRLRAILGLEQPSLRSRLPILACLVVIPAFLAVTLSQPVLRFTGAHSVRTDAEAFYVFDVSRSMSAAPAIPFTVFIIYDGGRDSPLRTGGGGRGASSPAAGQHPLGRRDHDGSRRAEPLPDR